MRDSNSSFSIECGFSSDTDTQLCRLGSRTCSPTAAMGISITLAVSFPSHFLGVIPSWGRPPLQVQAGEAFKRGNATRGLVWRRPQCGRRLSPAQNSERLGLAGRVRRGWAQGWEERGRGRRASGFGGAGARRVRACAVGGTRGGARGACAARARRGGSVRRRGGARHGGNMARGAGARA